MIRRTWRMLLAVPLAAELAVGVLFSTRDVKASNWTDLNGGSWADPTQWDTNPTIPNGNGAIANFSLNLNGATAPITLDGAKTVGSLSFDDPSGLGGTWSFAAGSGGNLIFSQQATNSYSVPATITLNNNVNVKFAQPIQFGTSNSTLISISGPGTLFMAVNPSGSGELKISGGAILDLQNFSNVGGTATGTPSDQIMLDGGALQFSTVGSNPATTRRITLGHAGPLDPANNFGAINVFTGFTFNPQFTNIFSGFGALVKNGGGILQLAGSGNAVITDRYAGATIVNGGTLAVSHVDNGGVSVSLTTNGTTSATVASATGLAVGMAVVGPNIAPDTTISSITGTTLTLSAAATGSGTNATDFGVLNAIGVSTNDPANLQLLGNATFGAPTFRYQGGASGTNGTTDRLFTIGVQGANLDASGSITTGAGVLNFTNAGTIALAGTNSARTLTLQGNNTGNNTLTGKLTDNGSGQTSITKTGTGTWILAGNNTYTGPTNINQGALGFTQASSFVQAQSTSTTTPL